MGGPGSGPRKGGGRKSLKGLSLKQANRVLRDKNYVPYRSGKTPKKWPTAKSFKQWHIEKRNK